MQKFDTNKVSIHAILVFLEVFDSKSVTHTAEKFDLNQSTISYTLDTLRKAFNDPLFSKRGRGIQPTELATQIEPGFRKIAAEFGGLFEQASLKELIDARPITIASNTTSLMSLLSSFKDCMALDYPDVATRFIDLGPVANTFDLLSTAEVDVVIAPRLRKHPNSLIINPLFTERHQIYYDPQCRGPIETVEDFVAANHAALDFGGGGKSLLQLRLEELGISRKITLSAPNAYSLSKLISGTDSIATLNASLSKSAMQDKASCPLPFESPSIEFDMIWLNSKNNSDRIHWISEKLTQAASEF